MKKSLEEIITEFRAIVGDDDRDEVIAMLEDLTDSYSPAAPAEPAEDLSGRVAELEAEVVAWKKKYRDRFNGRVEVEEDEETEDIKDPNGEDIKINDLFKERKE